MELDRVRGNSGLAVEEVEELQLALLDPQILREPRLRRRGLHEPDIFGALEQVSTSRGRELVDLLTARIEERVGKVGHVSEPRILALEASATRLREHDLADDEIAEPTLLLQEPNLRFVCRAVVATVLCEYECAVDSAQDVLDRIVVDVKHGGLAYGLAACVSRS